MEGQKVRLGEKKTSLPSKVDELNYDESNKWSEAKRYGIVDPPMGNVFDQKNKNLHPSNLRPIARFGGGAKQMGGSLTKGLYPSTSTGNLKLQQGRLLNPPQLEEISPSSGNLRMWGAMATSNKKRIVKLSEMGEKKNQAWDQYEKEMKAQKWQAFYDRLYTTKKKEFGDEFLADLDTKIQNRKMKAREILALRCDKLGQESNKVKQKKLEIENKKEQNNLLNQERLVNKYIKIAEQKRVREEKMADRMEEKRDKYKYIYIYIYID